jgi:hypothetical protein
MPLRCAGVREYTLNKVPWLRGGMVLGAAASTMPKAGPLDVQRYGCLVVVRNPEVRRELDLFCAVLWITGDDQ